MVAVAVQVAEEKCGDLAASKITGAWEAWGSRLKTVNVRNNSVLKTVKCFEGAGVVETMWGLKVDIQTQSHGPLS